MSENQQEKKHSGLFREKTMESMESPEALNEYLKVTSPGVWLVLSAVIVLLVGCILWGIFGRIRTTGTFAVSSEGGVAVCYVPYAQAEKVLAKGSITVDGREYMLRVEENVPCVQLDASADPYVLKAGGLSAGDVTALVPVLATLPDGVYAGEVLLEDLQPISLLLQ